MNQDQVEKFERLYKAKILNSGKEVTKSNLSTMKTHIKRVDKLLDEGDTRSEIISIIEQKISIETKIAYYNSIKVYSELFKLSADTRQYNINRERHIKERKKGEFDQKKSKKQEENMITYKDLVKMRKNMENRLKNQDWFNIQKFIIIALYSYIPPLRREYGEMFITYSKPSEDSKSNHLYINKKKMQIILNNYKTFDKYGTVIIENKEIPKKLKDIIRDYLNIREASNIHSPYLLLKRNGTMIGREYLTTITRNIFKNEIDKNITPSMIRTIFLTHLLSRSIPLVKHRRISRIMGHSTETSRKIYRKL